MQEKWIKTNDGVVINTEISYYDKILSERKKNKVTKDLETEVTNIKSDINQIKSMLELLLANKEEK